MRQHSSHRSDRSGTEGVVRTVRRLLAIPGIQACQPSDAAIEWTLESGKGSPSISLVKAKGSGIAKQHDRYSPGLHYLAWAADSREDVDRLYALLVEIKADVLDAPADYPQYNKGCGYYAVFFTDADGLKLECVFTPPR